jgi:hypothetical protein
VIQKVYRAFGYIITKTEFGIGDTLTENIGYCIANRFVVDKDVNFNLKKDEVNPKEFNHIWFITTGRAACFVEETGYKYTRTAGWNTLTDESPKGTINCSVIEPIDFFCIAPHLNMDKTPVVPSVTYYKLEQGSRDTLENTKLFLAAGEMIVGDQVVDSTTQIRINESKVIHAKTDCYGLIFN